MEDVVQQFTRRIRNVSVSFKRYLFSEINWEDRLIAIKGARGVGKTTMLLQRIKLNLSKTPLSLPIIWKLDSRIKYHFGCLG